MADSNTNYNETLAGTNTPVKAGMWDNYFKPLVNFETEVNCDDLDVVADQVLAEFGLTSAAGGTSMTYGQLPDLDIKRMDAMTALNYSLMEESFKGPYDRLIEAIVDKDGGVKFVEVGGGTAAITDVYYSMQTATFLDRPKGVMVTGGRPIPNLKPLEWIPIWAGEGPEGAAIFASYDMLGNCMQQQWKSQATIVFSDPNLNSSFNDGIDNLYEITNENPYDRIMGYAVYVEPPEDLVTTKTTVSYNNESEIPLKIASKEAGLICPIGKIQTQPSKDTATEDENCWGGMVGGEVAYLDGVPIEIPDQFRFETVRENTPPVDNFVNITGVYVIGMEISSLYSRPIDDASALKAVDDQNAEVWLSVDNTRLTSFKLDEKKHYAIAYEDIDNDGYQNISVVFGQEPRPGDNVTYGNGPNQTGREYYLDPWCALAREEGNAFVGGQLYTGTVLPYGGTKGILVDEIWVTAKVDIPSVSVYDPDGNNNRALQIAEDLKYYLAPLVMVEPPAPVAFCGSNGSVEEINQTPAIRDNDPTTVQPFDDTEMEQAMDEMSGSGFQITLSFLNGDANENNESAITSYNSAMEECKQAAQTLFDHMNFEVVETVYTCGPNCNPELCEATSDGQGSVINSIRYSYSDQGSYTVSVTAGPTVIDNLTPVDGGLTQKLAEDVSAKGTVIQALGDNIHFKVRIDGIGDRWAVNLSHNIIRERDVVSVSIHNNPVEA